MAGKKMMEAEQPLVARYWHKREWLQIQQEDGTWDGHLFSIAWRDELLSRQQLQERVFTVLAPYGHAYVDDGGGDCMICGLGSFNERHQFPPQVSAKVYTVISKYEHAYVANGEEDWCAVCGGSQGAPIHRVRKFDAIGFADTSPGTLRVGRKVGRTLYLQLGEEASDDDALVGVMDTVELARAVAERSRAQDVNDLLRRQLSVEEYTVVGLRGQLATAREALANALLLRGEAQLSEDEQEEEQESPHPVVQELVAMLVTRYPGDRQLHALIGHFIEGTPVHSLLEEPVVPALFVPERELTLQVDLNKLAGRLETMGDEKLWLEGRVTEIEEERERERGRKKAALELADTLEVQLAAIKRQLDIVVDDRNRLRRRHEGNLEAYRALLARREELLVDYVPLAVHDELQTENSSLHAKLDEAHKEIEGLRKHVFEADGDLREAQRFISKRLLHEQRVEWEALIRERTKQRSEHAADELAEEARPVDALICATPGPEADFIEKEYYRGCGLCGRESARVAHANRVEVLTCGHDGFAVDLVSSIQLAPPS